MASASPAKTRTRSPRSRTSSKSSVAPASLEGFENFCSKLTLTDGKPFVLRDEQRQMVADYFDGVTETLILISKKNGKTTLLAALALHHLLVTPDAECVIAAASRDQAQILLNQARGFVRRSTLGRYLTVKQREIVSLRDEGRVRVMASDSETADGVIPTLAIVDELHRHKDNGAMYGVFHDGLGPRDGRIVTISTAGEDEDSPLGRLRKAAYEIPGLKRDGVYRYARSENFAMHEWALDADQDCTDMELVAQANPLHTIEKLRERYESPSMQPDRWARFACGVWVRIESAWVEPDAWDRCAGTTRFEAQSRIWVGVDIGHAQDSTAVVAVAWVDGKLHVKAKIRTPTPGHRVASTDARTDILDLVEKFRVMEVPFDPWRFSESAEMLEGEGIRMVRFDQHAARMGPASEKLYELIREGRLVHDGDPILREHVLAAVPEETERGVKISKRKSKKRIDAAVALAMAADRAVHSQTAPRASFEVLL